MTTAGLSQPIHAEPLFKMGPGSCWKGSCSGVAAWEILGYELCQEHAEAYAKKLDRGVTSATANAIRKRMKP